MQDSLRVSRVVYDELRQIVESHGHAPFGHVSPDGSLFLFATIMPTPLGEKTVGDLHFSEAGRLVECNGKVLELSPMEAKLLFHLADFCGHPCRNKDITKALWPKIPPGDPVNNIKVFLSRIRRKLDDAGSKMQIESVLHGFAYKMTYPPLEELEHD